MKKSYKHAILAFIYIIALVSIMSLKIDKEGNPILTGITVLSTIVFSVALMGYLFASQPILMYIDGKKSQAIRFFMETLVAFGILALIAGIISMIFLMG